MVMHPTSSPSMTRRRPASAPLKSHIPYEKYLPDEKTEDLTDGPRGASNRISHCRQVVYPPWGYNAGGEGSPVVIMNGAGVGGGGGGGSGLGTSRPGSSSGKSEKRFGFDRKRMLLPSPAFGFVSPKQPQSRSQTSMSCYSEQPQPWYSGGSRSHTPDIQTTTTSSNSEADPSSSSTQRSQQKIHFRRSSLPIRSQAGSPAPGGQNPNSGQRSRNSSGTGSCAGGRTSAQSGSINRASSATSRRRPPLMSSSSFSGRLPFNRNHPQFEDIRLSGLVVSSMKLCERPGTPKKRPKSSNENHIQEFATKDQKPSVYSHRRNSKNGSFHGSNSGSRRGSIEQLIRTNAISDEVNEMFLSQAAAIDDKFCLDDSGKPIAPQPKVEMFVKMYPSPHEELEDIESSDDETEICEIKTPERSPSKKQRSPRKERKP